MTPKIIYNLLDKVEKKKKSSLSLLEDCKFDNGLEKAMKQRIYDEYFESYKKIVKNY